MAETPTTPPLVVPPAPQRTTIRPPQPESISRTKATGIALVLLVSTSMGFLGGWLGAESRARNNGTLSSQDSRQIVTSESRLISTIAKDVGPSVVSINATEQRVTNGFFGPRSVEQKSAGTGFIIENDVIVTNRHVIPGGGGTVSVTLSDGTELTDVEVIGRTNNSDPLDVAFLKIKDKKGKDLKPVKLGDSSKVEVGDKVVAIGNALGQFQNSVTSGIISGFSRNVEASDGSSVESLQNLLQTDAAINQGNSGGPLVDMNGEVIAINTAVAEDSENIGFAIPINDAKGLIKSVLEKGKLERPFLGVRYVSITDDYAVEFNLPVKRGAYIIPSTEGNPSVLADSPAAKAGLKEKDIITKVNDTEINENNSLTSVLGRFTVGEKVTVTIHRDGKEQKIEVKLEAMPQE